ncbi:MFS transporter [Desulfosporosinus shakirovi]|uniref:MFS transporter n=1 Tax=Desulfosporosinus shakirovi TaxID=2885154 RepID=UPI001E3F0284|nr:MFS transporter [Desulfosporosinus sp. SRJS8]MCB8817843.1 MFS transporter [Desulfosporosinus sp. SRJS8]
METGVRIKNNYFDGLKVSKMHLFIFVLVSISYFFEQFDSINFSFIAPSFMASMKVGPIVLAQINSAYFFGMAFGGLIGGIISDIIGRRKSIILSVTIFSLGSILNGLVHSVPLFILARGITGFGVFMMLIVSIAYMAEMSPKESRGKWEGLISALGFLSIPIVGIVCRAIIPIHPEAWRYIFYLGGIGLVAAVLSLKFLKESPRWLVSKGRVAEAEQIVYEVSGVNVDLSDSISTKSEKMKMKHVAKEMFSPLYLKRTLILLVTVCLTTICAQLLSQWQPTLLNLYGFSVKESLTLGIIFSFGATLGQLSAAFFSDKGGRKVPIVSFSILSAFFTLAFLLVGKNFALLAIIGLLITITQTGRSFIIHPYVAESYPTKLRNTAVGLINFVARFSIMAIQPLIPIIYAGYGIPGVYGILTAFSVILAIVVGVFGWRSALRSLEDINEKAI